jgi:hypothetical protein
MNFFFLTQPVSTRVTAAFCHDSVRNSAGWRPRGRCTSFADGKHPIRRSKGVFVRRRLRIWNASQPYEVLRELN